MLSCADIKKQNIFSEAVFDLSNKNYSTITVARDLRKCLVQPPAQSWVNRKARVLRD